jgi:hypothetical protein
VHPHLESARQQLVFVVQHGMIDGLIGLLPAIGEPMKADNHPSTAYLFVTATQACDLSRPRLRSTHEALCQEIQCSQLEGILKRQMAGRALQTIVIADLRIANVPSTT